MRYPVALLAAHAALVAVACRDTLFPDEPRPTATVAPVATPSTTSHDSLSLAEIEELDGRVDSLMAAIQQHEEDVAAMQALAELYERLGAFGAAIGPLARALELEPGRGDLWMALGRALERSGRTGKVSDADLAAAAREFVEEVRMAGAHC
jgi:Flp pilus assembly protein TadD